MSSQFSSNGCNFAKSSVLSQKSLWVFLKDRQPKNVVFGWLTPPMAARRARPPGD
jgi:hypothetical protein